MPETTYCPKHPGTATSLRCGKCDRPVCPQCMVHTPVGVRCQDCAQMRRLPTFEVSGSYLARGIVASLAIGTGGGLVLVFLTYLGLFALPFLFISAVAGLGYLIGEGTSIATNRKRGRPLQFAAAAGVLVAYAITVVAIGGIGLYDLLGLAIGVAIAVGRLR